MDSSIDNQGDAFPTDLFYLVSYLKYHLQPNQLYNNFKNVDIFLTNHIFSRNIFISIELCFLTYFSIFKNYKEKQKIFHEYKSPIQIGEIEEEDKFSIKLKENYKIDLTVGNFRRVLGFEAKTYENNEQIAEYTSN